MKNLVSSLVWLIKSKNSGYSQADPAIKIVMQSMTQEQIKKANKLIGAL